ncbi:MAG: hypothetical protein WCI88_15725 [Chloroflexota bacterium]
MEKRNWLRVMACVGLCAYSIGLVGCGDKNNRNEVEDRTVTRNVLLKEQAETAKNIANQDREVLQTAQAMNYCVLATTRIINSGSLIVADQEYHNIINNINLEKIDPDIKAVCVSLLDLVIKIELNEKQRQQVDDMCKIQVERAFRDAWIKGGMNFIREATGGEASVSMNGQNEIAHTSISGSMGVYASGQPALIAAKVLSSAVSAVGTSYLGYVYAKDNAADAQTQTSWKIKDKQIEEFHKIRKNIFDCSYQLTQSHKLPDCWRLSEAQITEYIKLVDNPQYASKPEELARMLEYQREKFAAFPPFWYQLGKAYQNAGQKDKAKVAYDYFTAVDVGVIREDIARAGVRVGQIGLLDTKNDRKQIEKYFAEIHRHAPNDPTANLFIATKMLAMEMNEDAVIQLRYNINKRLMFGWSVRLLGQYYWTTGRKDDFKKLIDETVELTDTNDRCLISIFDLAYLAEINGEIGMAKRVVARLEKIRLKIGFPERSWFEDETRTWGLVDFPRRYFNESYSVWDEFPEGHSSRLEHDREWDKLPPRDKISPVVDKSEEGKVTYPLWIRFMYYVRNYGPDVKFTLMLQGTAPNEGKIVKSDAAERIEIIYSGKKAYYADKRGDYDGRNEYTPVKVKLLNKWYEWKDLSQ